MNLIEKFLADTEGMHLFLPEANGRRVYLFLGRTSLLVVSREGNRILHQVPLTLTIQILGPARFAFVAEGQQLVFETQEPDTVGASSGEVTSTPTDQVFYGEGTTSTAAAWTKEGQSPALQSEPYPFKAQCDRCKNKKRCANYDVVNGKKFQLGGDRGLPVELHAEYDQYCEIKIKTLGCAPKSA